MGLSLRMEYRKTKVMRCQVKVRLRIQEISLAMFVEKELVILMSCM